MWRGKGLSQVDRGVEERGVIGEQIIAFKGAERKWNVGEMREEWE